MAMENFHISGYSDDGTGPRVVYHLEAYPSRRKMVGSEVKNKGGTLWNH